ncbi:hypothetical protein ILYODFUR_029229 [Ilyodon furcidens]|uniref:Secreted protein n=1 Tax=Ilyodon furcidens TaxID=33524 RepID=A0ABV0T2L4_9TELE
MPLFMSFSVLLLQMSASVFVFVFVFLLLLRGFSPAQLMLRPHILLPSQYSVFRVLESGEYLDSRPLHHSPSLPLQQDASAPVSTEGHPDSSSRSPSVFLPPLRVSSTLQPLLPLGIISTLQLPPTSRHHHHLHP